MPASAVTVTLNFSGDICGVAGDQSCGNGSQIGQNYGDTTGLDVSHASYTSPGGVLWEAYLKTWFGGYGDLDGGVVWGGSNANNYYSELVFDALPGYEVSLRSFQTATYLGRSASSPFNITNLGGGTTILNGSINTNWPTHNDVTVNSAYFTDGIRLRWGPDGYDVGLDNIVLDVRVATAGPGPIPEPTTWALMILGFGGAGAMLRRRRLALAGV